MCEGGLGLCEGGLVLCEGGLGLNKKTREEEVV
jgi:hypothetical protein